jgi:hypothetical protein
VGLLTDKLLNRFELEEEQAIRQDEREKVLDFYKWVKKLAELELIEEQSEFTDCANQVLFEFDKRFPELRKGGEQG